jgi:phage terminase large subunit-like protein
MLLFPPAESDTLWRMLPYFWVPQDNVARRVHHDHVPYDLWIKQGFIKATQGNVIDYGVIRQDILDARELYSIREIAFDRWNATQLTTQLTGDGLVMVPFGQGFTSMSSPCREGEGHVTGHLLAHGMNPVLRWMASNVSVKQDPAGNMKPDKETSSEKIDGIVAWLEALGRAIVQPGTSVYENSELLIL